MSTQQNSGRLEALDAKMKELIEYVPPLTPSLKKSTFPVSLRVAIDRVLRGRC